MNKYIVRFSNGDTVEIKASDFSIVYDKERIFFVN